jgi:stage V sporulation protein G
MKITEVKVYPIKNQEKDKRLKAYATIVFENCFIVRDLKIILGNDGGLFVSMPSRRSKFGSFKDIAHPLNSSVRNEIEKAVLGEYEKVLANPHANDMYDGE